MKSLLLKMRCLKRLGFIFAIGLALQLQGATQKPSILNFTNTPLPSKVTNIHGGRITYLMPTNTMAFQTYALDLVLSKANSFGEKFDLGLPHPIQKHDITSFVAVPKTNSFDVEISVSGTHRFTIGGSDPGPGALFCGMSQDLYSTVWHVTPITFDPEKNDIRLKAISKMLPAVLSKKEAIAIVEKSLRNKTDRIELDRARLIQAKVMVHQSQGRTFPLPLVEVDWGPYRFEVSAATKQIVAMSSLDPDVVISMPTNYFKLFGSKD